MSKAVPPAKAARAATTPQLRFRVRVTVGDLIPIGPGKIDLLEAVRVQGSISAAARHLGMSYRRAWLLLDEMNQTLKSPVISTAQGGAARGGAVLTPTGEAVVDRYRSIEAIASSAAAKEMASLLRLVAKP